MGGLRTWDRLGIIAARANALKNHWLIDDAAAAEVADDQPRTAVTPKKVELARIGPSATMPSFGVCPEPAPIKPGNLLQWARHRDGALRQNVWPAAHRRPHQFRSRRTFNFESYL
jgi:hypothetical protein